MGGVRGPMTSFAVLNKFIEKSPIVDHRLAKILRCSLVVSVTNGDFVGGVIMLDYHRVVN